MFIVTKEKPRQSGFRCRGAVLFVFKLEVLSIELDQLRDGIFLFFSPFPDRKIRVENIVEEFELAEREITGIPEVPTRKVCSFTIPT